MFTLIVLLYLVFATYLYFRARNGYFTHSEYIEPMSRKKAFIEGFIAIPLLVVVIITIALVGILGAFFGFILLITGVAWLIMNMS